MLNKKLIIIILIITNSIYAQNDEESRDLRGRLECKGGSGVCMDIGLSQIGIDAKNIENSIYLILPKKYFTDDQENFIRDPEQDFFFHIIKNVALMDETLKKYEVNKEFNVVPSGRYPVEFSNDQYKIKVSLNRSK